MGGCGELDVEKGERGGFEVLEEGGARETREVGGSSSTTLLISTGESGLNVT